MDKHEYVKHTKARIIQNFIREMDSISDDEILECGRSCPSCLGAIIDKTTQDSAIVEGITPDEVDRMVGVDESHDCKPGIFFSNMMPSMVDDGDDSDEDDEPAEEIVDDHIMDSLREALDMLSASPNAHLILAYMYTSNEGDPSSTKDIQGQSMIFGSRKFIDYLMDDIREQINANTNDGQVSMGDAIDDPE